ncbi:MAG TPA: hypothetical protein VL728_15020 [Cyclobacteriaceae bacterium]|jgi:hypothetical protein|nr:hypothetical protein [Cyclobacteriaceae bacterium]
MKFQRIYKELNATSYILSLLLIAELIIFSWCINKGFDFSDEAYGYLGFINPKEVQHAGTYYTTLYTFFWGWLGVGIVKVRIIRMLLLIVCGAIFAYGLIEWSKRKAHLTGTQQINLFLFVLLGCFHINGNGSQSLTYNLSSTFLFLISTGSFLYVYQRTTLFSKQDMVIFFLLGSLLFGLFAVKFSNAIIMAIALAALFIIDGRSLKLKGLYLLISIGGSLTMAVLLFGFDVAQWAIDYYHTLASVGNSSSTSIWSRYLEDFNNVKTNLVIALIPWIVLSICCVVTTQYSKSNIIKLTGALLFAGVMIYITYQKILYLGGAKHIYVISFFNLMVLEILIGALGVSKIISTVQKKQTDNTYILLCLFLAAIPFFGSIGTSNLLSVQVIWYSPFFFASLFLLLHFFDQRFVLNILVVVIAVHGALIASGLIFYPYRINDTLAEQTVPLPEEIGEQVMLDSALAKSVTNVYELIQSKSKFTKGGPVFSFRSEYGFIYFLKGNLPGWGWYKDESPELNCKNLRKTNILNLNETIFIVPKEYKMDSTFQSCLKEIQISFPEKYEAVGEVSYSFEGTKRDLKIFVPLALKK